MLVNQLKVMKIYHGLIKNRNNTVIELRLIAQQHKMIIDQYKHQINTSSLKFYKLFNPKT